MKSTRKKGIKAGIICFSVFMAPWLFAIIYALVTDPAGFRMENIAGIIIGIFIFILVSAFLGFSIAKQSRILILLSSLAVLAVPLAWWYMPWIP